MQIYTVYAKRISNFEQVNQFFLYRSHQIIFYYKPYIGLIVKKTCQIINTD